MRFAIRFDNPIPLEEEARSFDIVRSLLPITNYIHYYGSPYLPTAKMRLRHRRSPLLLFLIPSFAASAALAASSSSSDVSSDNDGAGSATFSPIEGAGPGGFKAKYDIGTKDAPVDGKDGRPHEGPFVEIENLRKIEGGESKKYLPPLKDRPADPTIVDGKRIPESNDGVMDDKNRPEPKEGTTGTGGGVSEKDKARKAMEGKTGEKVENKPETPKEAPPLPHSEQEKILNEKEKAKDKLKEKNRADAYSDDVAGFEVREEHPTAH